MAEDTRARHMRTAAEMASACLALAGEDTDRAVDLLADRVRAAPAIRQAICETFFRDNLIDEALAQIGAGRRPTTSTCTPTRCIYGGRTPWKFPDHPP